MARGSAKGWQCFVDGWNLDPSWSWRTGEDECFPFVPEKFHTPPNVVEPDNVPDLMFVEPEALEVGEAEEDPPATSSGSDLQPPAPPAPRLSWLAPLKTPPWMEKMVLYMGDVRVIGTRVGTAAISACPFMMEGLVPEEENAEQCSMP